MSLLYTPSVGWVGRRLKALGVPEEPEERLAEWRAAARVEEGEDARGGVDEAVRRARADVEREAPAGGRVVDANDGGVAVDFRAEARAAKVARGPDDRARPEPLGARRAREVRAERRGVGVPEEGGRGVGKPLPTRRVRLVRGEGRGVSD
jgi:hypothetical protein